MIRRRLFGRLEALEYVKRRFKFLEYARSSFAFVGTSVIPSEVFPGLVALDETGQMIAQADIDCLMRQSLTIAAIPGRLCYKH
jgi:hypothetical protein